jgi:hypothetical protein
LPARASCHQCLAFTCPHFGNPAVVKHHAANQLHIEMTHSEHALACFAHDCKCLRQQHIEIGSFPDALPELFGLSTQLSIAQRRNRRFQRIDRRHGL